MPKITNPANFFPLAIQSHGYAIAFRGDGVISIHGRIETDPAVIVSELASWSLAITQALIKQQQQDG